jgi:hypothetical protein
VVTTEDVQLMLRVEALEHQARLVWLREYDGDLCGLRRVWGKVRIQAIERLRSEQTVSVAPPDPQPEEPLSPRPAKQKRSTQKHGIVRSVACR